VIPAASSGFGPCNTNRNQNCPLHPVWYAPVMLCCVISIFSMIDACFFAVVLEGPNFLGGWQKLKFYKGKMGIFTSISGYSRDRKRVSDV